MFLSYSLSFSPALPYIFISFFFLGEFFPYLGAHVPFLPSSVLIDPGVFSTEPRLSFLSESFPPKRLF